MELTANCNKCHLIKRIKQIHIDIPIILVLDCNHRIHLSIPNMVIKQDI